MANHAIKKVSTTVLRSILLILLIGAILFAIIEFLEWLTYGAFNTSFPRAFIAHRLIITLIFIFVNAVTLKTSVNYTKMDDHRLALLILIVPIAFFAIGFFITIYFWR